MTNPLTNPQVSELIANRLANGLFHPGDGADQGPMTIRLPMFRAIGAAPELVRQVDLTTKLIAEAIVYLIEHDGGYDLVPRPPEPPPEPDPAVVPSGPGPLPHAAEEEIS